MDKLIQEDAGGALLSCDFIEQELEEGQIRGSFSMESMYGKAIKGKVIVSDPRVKCQEAVFQGESVKISYYFDGSEMEPGEIVSGFFMLITNLGEYEIPFSFSYPKADLTSSLGEIRNVFHFTNLARSNWQEALKLYFSPEFEEVLKNADSRTKEIYRGLSGQKREQFMDEFLHAIHKKSPVRYEIRNDLTGIVNVCEPICVELIIQKNGWGYICLDVEKQGDFIKLEKDKILEEDFKGNVYHLPVYIDAAKLHQGKNWGEITLSSPYETKKIPVLVSQSQHHRMRSAIEKRRNAKWLNSKLTNTYLYFRSKDFQ